ncbi:RtcB family protein [Vallitalea maricola]|uniref:RtcB family protein n=1 Tax=Vallitalea maricola TaxID=3074433 RepID=A0ACB5UMD6_9FIRM|nr:RtcB family protein [Vallitalea sp. AN17-2]
MVHEDEIYIIDKGVKKMFVIYNKEKNRIPIKIWVEDKSKIENECMAQATNLSNLPFLHKWVCLMPDTHTGKGMPIGGVIAAENVIIPNAVGVDIGCGMAFIQTNIPVRLLKETKTPNGTLLQGIIGDILRNIPVGFSHHTSRQECKILDDAIKNLGIYQDAKDLIPELEDGYYQIRTLGGGNHFIELQEDEQGLVCIMLHTGSRHFGYKICDYYHKLARELNTRWFSSVPDEYRLAFLPVNTKEGQDYINWMSLALGFASENRSQILDNVINIVNKWVKKHCDFNTDYTDLINCHHNYAAIEHHYGKNVWVHRKGAIRVRENELGIIPGAMGSYSYIVKGKGNPESFHSCSHGAGRLMSRKKAMETFGVDEVINDLKASEVIIGKRSKKDIPEESKFAYKDIDTVINNELDLIEPIKKLKTIGVVKG